MPADAEVLDGALLLVDESSPTGESVPVAKTPGGDGSRGTVSGARSSSAGAAGPWSRPPEATARSAGSRP